LVFKSVINDQNVNFPGKQIFYSNYFFRSTQDYY
jgi:hypothetical protein